MMERLNERERLFIIIGALLIVAALLFTAINYIVTQRSEIRERVFSSRQDVATMMRLKSSIQSMPISNNTPEKAQFLQSVNQLLERHNLKYSNMREQKEKVDGRRGAERLLLDINFNGVELPPLINFLYDVEVRKQSGGRIYKFEIFHRLPGRDVYDVNLQIGIEVSQKGQ